MKFARKRLLINPEQYEKLKTDQTSPPSDPYRIPHPSAKTAKKHYNDVKQTLSSVSYSEFDKTLHHAQELQKYLQSLRDALTIPKSIAYLGNSVKSAPYSEKEESRDLTPPSFPSPTPEPNEKRGAIEKTPSRGKKRLKKTLNKDIQSPPSSSLTPPSTPSVPKTRSRAYSNDRLIAELTATAEEKRDLTKTLDMLQKNPNFSWNTQSGKIRFKRRAFPESNIKALLADVLTNKRHLSDRDSYDAVMQALR